jgi:hypothetical protein
MVSLDLREARADLVEILAPIAVPVSQEAAEAAEAAVSGRAPPEVRAATVMLPE